MEKNTFPSIFSVIISIFCIISHINYAADVKYLVPKGEKKQVIVDTIQPFPHPGDGVVVLENFGSSPVRLEGYNDQEDKKFTTKRGSLTLQPGESTKQNFPSDVDIRIKCFDPKSNSQINCGENISYTNEECPKGCKYTDALNLGAGD